MLPLAIAVLTSFPTLSGQVETMVSDVGTRVRTISQADYTVSIYEYEGVFVIGELSVADFREAIGLVRPQLVDHERITEIVVSAPTYAPRPAPETDIVVRTCSVACDAGRMGRRAGAGRVFELNRSAGKIRVFRVLRWYS